MVVHRGGRGWILRKLRLPHFLQGSKRDFFTGQHGDVWFFFYLGVASMGFFAPLFSTASKVWTSSIRLFFLYPS